MSKLTRLILEKLNKGIAAKKDITILYEASKRLITLSLFYDYVGEEYEYLSSVCMTKVV